MIAFNSDEDLVLMTAEGRIFVIDIFLVEIKQNLYFEGFTKNDAIEEGKL
jgi:hypothetical protein